MKNITMKKQRMKTKLSFFILSVLSLFSGVVSAHSGHGEHAANYASSLPHPEIGIEHFLLLSTVVAVVYMALGLIRK